MKLEITETDAGIIEEALKFLYGHYVNLATRSRSFSKKAIHYKDAAKREERVKEIRAKYSANADEVSDLMYKVDVQINSKS